MAKEFPELKDAAIESRYKAAKKVYEDNGINVDEVVDVVVNSIPLSMHCWQGDDVRGFESTGPLTGGIMATGNFPGAARNAKELRQDAEKAFSMIPGTPRFNLHAIYLENHGKPVGRDAICYENFSEWVEWAKVSGIGLDFNPTFFSHPDKKLAGLTLSNPSRAIRRYWIEHALRCREISEMIAKEKDDDVVLNYWTPDGMKDTPVDRKGPRDRLGASYAEIFAKKIDKRVKESVEGKLFGMGVEAYTVGSHEFLFGIAMKHQKMLCLDMGHFHPTETINDKLSAVLPYVPGVLVHMSRGVRWDSDHVVLYNDELRDVAHELVRGGALTSGKVYLATDYFDASINRVGAWVTGQRAVYKAVLNAMLEPGRKLAELEMAERGYEKQALLEAQKTMPFGDIWNYVCMTSVVPTDNGCINQVVDYQRKVLDKRN